jgi:nicotinate-nucleotide adenylyltransferase
VTSFRDAIRFGIFGGTFDPPHNGHFRVAAEVATTKSLDCVLFIPAARPWQKSEYSQPEDRLAMTTLGARWDSRFAVSRIELDRQGPTYTIDTLSDLKKLCKPKAEFSFILGVDAAINLGTWHRAQELARMTKFLVVTRPGYRAENLAVAWGEPQIEVLQVAPVDVSSTKVRAAIRQGRSIDDLVPTEVGKYIRERGLYRAGVEAGEG